jgi:hypothetical protein
LKTFLKTLLSFAVLGGLTRAAVACDSCALYLAEGTERPGFTASIAHQYTRLGTLWNGATKTGNPIDQFVDSHITQVGVGYSTGGPWHVQLTVPYVDRTFFRPDHALTERGRDQGLGDLVLAGRYRVLTATRNNDEWAVHILGGMKLGTGNADRLKPANHVHHHFVPSGVHEHDLALGSGSTDWLIGADASWVHASWFARAQIQHELRRPGAFGYRFGDETSWELGAGRHLLLTPGKTLSLQALFSGDRRSLDSLGDIPDDDTGMNVSYLGARVAGTLGQRFAADASFELPIRIRTTVTMVVPDFRLRAAVNWRF